MSIETKKKLHDWIMGQNAVDSILFVNTINAICTNIDFDIEQLSDEDLNEFFTIINLAYNMTNFILVYKSKVKPRRNIFKNLIKKLETSLSVLEELKEYTENESHSNINISISSIEDTLKELYYLKNDDKLKITNNIYHKNIKWNSNIINTEISYTFETNFMHDNIVNIDNDYKKLTKIMRAAKIITHNDVLRLAFYSLEILLLQNNNITENEFMQILDVIEEMLKEEISLKLNSRSLLKNKKNLRYNSILVYCKKVEYLLPRPYLEQYPVFVLNQDTTEHFIVNSKEEMDAIKLT